MAVRFEDRLLGTAAEAGALCVTDLSPRGVSAETYRSYVRSQGAPPPFERWDDMLGRRVVARDERGARLFDLDAVKAWNRARPGKSTRYGRPLGWSPIRHLLLVGARDGRLTAVPGDRLGRVQPHLDGVRQHLRDAQRVGELLRAGLLDLDTDEGRYRITDAGRAWLAEHTDDANATAEDDDRTPCRA